MTKPIPRDDDGLDASMTWTEVVRLANVQAFRRRLREDRVRLEAARAMEVPGAGVRVRDSDDEPLPRARRGSR